MAKMPNASTIFRLAPAHLCAITYGWNIINSYFDLSNEAKTSFISINNTFLLQYL